MLTTDNVKGSLLNNHFYNDKIIKMTFYFIKQYKNINRALL